MSEEPEFEEGVCVCCKAASETVFDALNAPVCIECKEDGTFKTWLVAELEKFSRETGYKSRVDERGRTLWSPP